eukprot:520642_1
MASEEKTVVINSKEIVTDKHLLFKLTGVKFTKQQALKKKEFTITVDSSIISNSILNVIGQSDFKWHKKVKFNALRTIFTELVPSEFVPVATDHYKDTLDIDANLAVLHARCVNHVNGCSTSVHVSFKPYDVAILKRTDMNILFEHYKCHKLPVGLINGMISGGVDETNDTEASVVTQYEPRILQIMSYSKSEYNPYGNDRKVHTHSAMRQLRSKTLNKAKLHDDWYQSLKLKQSEEHKDPAWSHLPAIHRGNIHELSDAPKANVCLWNPKVGALALKYGKATNLSFHIDSAENITRKMIGEGDMMKWIHTFIIVPSPANQEPLWVMQMHSSSRYAHTLRKSFVAWYSYLTFLNKGKKPILRNWTMDCYGPYFNDLCWVLNGVTGDEYLSQFWLSLKRNEEIFRVPTFRSYFNQCTKHVVDDFKNQIKNDKHVMKSKE